MKTQELKQYIDRVLGNSIRCLLPSYWWKRAFGAVIDSVDEKLDSKSIKTINGESVIGEGDLKIGVTSVGSVEELEKLNAEIGDVATAVYDGEYQEVFLKNCTASITPKNDWDNLTRIRKIELKQSPSIASSFGFYFSACNEHVYEDVICVGFDVGEDKLLYFLSKHGRTRFLSLDEVNNILNLEDYRFVFDTDSGITYSEQFFNFYTWSTTANAYIKGETWERLLKEGDVTGGGPEIRELTFGETEEDRANHVKIYNKIVEAFNSDDIYMPMISVEGLLVSNVTLSVSEGETTANLNVIADFISSKVIFPLSLTKTGEVEVEEELQYSSYYHITSASSMVNFAKCVAAGLLPNVLYADPRQGLVIADTFNGEGDNIVLYFNLSKGRTKVVVSSETGEILSEEVVSSGGADITIDSELSDTSENPVQNKAIKAYIDNAITNTLNTEV